MASCVDRLNIFKRNDEQQFRAFEVLGAFQKFSWYRKHVPLDKCLREIFPKLFQFQVCGVMFYSKKEDSLYKIIHLSDDDLNAPLNSFKDKQSDGSIVRVVVKDYESLVFYPKNIGCTGNAIAKKKVVYFNKSQRDLFFSGEIDNSVGVQYVDSLMIGAMYDTDGQLRGVIQLINKLDGQQITEQDVVELQSMLSSIAENIRTCDEVKQLHNIGTALAENLHHSNDLINASIN